jgi:hypothetical protein
LIPFFDALHAERLVIWDILREGSLVTFFDILVLLLRKWWFELLLFRFLRGSASSLLWQAKQDEAVLERWLRLDQLNVILLFSIAISWDMI